jgi:hypothetical protein
MQPDIEPHVGWIEGAPGLLDRNFEKPKLALIAALLLASSPRNHGNRRWVQAARQMRRVHIERRVGNELRVRDERRSGKQHHLADGTPRWRRASLGRTKLLRSA